MLYAGSSIVPLTSHLFCLCVCAHLHVLRHPIDEALTPAVLFIPLIGSFVFFTFIIGLLPRYMSCENAIIVSHKLYYLGKFDRKHHHRLGSLNPF